MTIDHRDGSPNPAASPDLCFDPDSLRAKYREGRNKRLRADGGMQGLACRYAEPDAKRRIR